jgi:hypothetical protein
MKPAVLLALVAFGTGASAETPRTGLLDLSADVLEPGESEFGLVWLRYARGVAPGLELSSHLAGDAATLINLRIKYRALNRPELRLSLEASPTWLAAAKLIDTSLIRVPIVARGTFPIALQWDATVSGIYDLIFYGDASTAFQARLFSGELVVARYDAGGSVFVRAELPLFSTQQVRLTSLLGDRSLSGALTLDDLAAWSLMVGRDHIFGRSGHVRFAIGYRNRPGLLFLQSFNRIVAQFDIYWR